MKKTHRLFIGTRHASEDESPWMPILAGSREPAHGRGHGRCLFQCRARNEFMFPAARDNDVGSVFVYQQKDADHYELIGKIPTRSGAGTSFGRPNWIVSTVGAPAHDHEESCHSRL